MCIHHQEDGGDCVMTPLPRPLLAALGPRALVRVPAALIPIRLPANEAGKGVNDSPSTWAPATHVRDPGGGPGFWFLGNVTLPFKQIDKCTF